jgi:hypothetical protein
MTKVDVMTEAISGGLQCGARKRQGAGLCSQPAGWGTTHPGFGACKLHGGSTPGAVKAAAEAEGIYLLGKMVGIREPVDDPFVELRRIGALALAWMEACQGAIKDLKDFRFLDAKGAEQLRSEIPMFERSMDHAATLLATIAKLGLDEREVAVSEAKATMMLRALEAGLAENGISGPQAAAVKQATGRHLKLAKAG